MPTAPDTIWYEHETPLLVTFRWSAAIVGADTTIWRVYDKHGGMADTLLSEVPVGQTYTDVPIALDSLSVVVVRGVDDLGNESADSPNITFSARQGFPIVTLTPWSVNRREASIGWSVVSRSFIAVVHWKLTDGVTILEGSGTSDDSASFPVQDLVGTVTLTLTVRDAQDRITRLVSQVAVWNVAPGIPTLETTEIGVHLIGIKATPGVGLSQTSQIILEGPGGTFTLSSPYTHTFEGLTAGTGYAFRARAVNPSGYVGPQSERLLVDTIGDPDSPSNAGVSLGYLPVLLDLLTGDLIGYILQLYSATRSRDPFTTQIIQPPVGLSALLDYFLPLASRFGDIIRSETSSEPNYRASELIDTIADPLMKLAIYCEVFLYGEVWELS